MTTNWPTSSAYWLALLRSHPELRRAATPRLNRYIPQKPTIRQAAFLLLPGLEAFFGGAGGGGKSSSLLMAALQYVDQPGYSALILRRSYPDLSLPGAIMARSHEWLDGTDAKWSGDTHTWTFPSGARLAFGYLDTQGAEQRYRSAEFQTICFDELTQFSEEQYRFLFSRLRRPEGMHIPLRMRSASNPGDTGHDWVKARFVNPGSPERPFIRSLLGDNPYIDQVGYRASLSRLDPVTQAQIERGDWDVAREGAIAQRAWFPVVDVAPAQARRARHWDFAATMAKKGGDPDYTVGTRLALADGTYYVESVVRGRWGPGDVEKVLRQTAETDGRHVGITIEQEPGSSGKLFTASVVKALAGWTIRAVPATGDKITRAMPFFAQAQGGNVRLIRGGWNAAWLDEITSVPNGAHNDQMDSVSGAFAALTSRGGWAQGPAA